MTINIIIWSIISTACSFGAGYYVGRIIDKHQVIQLLRLSHKEGMSVKDILNIIDK